MLVHNEVFLSPHCIMPARSPFYRSEDTKPLMQGFPSNGTSQCWPRNQASINGNTVLAPFPLTGIGFLPVVVSAFPFGVSETREDHAARDQDGLGGGGLPWSEQRDFRGSGSNKYTTQSGHRLSGKAPQGLLFPALAHSQWQAPLSS